MVSALGIVTVILGMYSVFGYLDPQGSRPGRIQKKTELPILDSNAQSFQKSLIKEYTLNHIGILNMM